ncbi:hypothetical protein cand_029650 [Cryptosporidium andersoni]|uniref:Uncharacterized protein n=1 Tax=Cryptosporidium andersoni TaxID=117008 RepID=A0A1J4MNH1_9CRYT|nr:hypothetical protein cand_029650 [Cryptosporidium andersoni]
MENKTGDSSFNKELASSNTWRYLLLQSIANKLEKDSNWFDIRICWCPIISNTVVTAFRTSDNSDFMNYSIILPFEYYGLVNIEHLLNYYGDIEYDFKSCGSNSIRVQVICAYIGCNNDLLLQAVSLY